VSELNEVSVPVSETKPKLWSPDMSEEERLAILAVYNPEDHVTSWDKGGQALMYYPAAWRLYELKLRFPNSHIDIETPVMNLETGHLLLKALLYVDGVLKETAYKQGSFSNFDRLETNVRARAAKNFGISPTLTLDMDDDLVTEVAAKAQQQTKIREESTKANKEGQNGTSSSYAKTSAPVARAQRSAPPVSASEPMITPNQLDELQKRYRYLQEQSPQDVKTLTFAAAKKRIEELDARCKIAQASRPPSK